MPEKNIRMPSCLLETLCKWQPIKMVIILPWRENGLKKIKAHEIKIWIRNLGPNWFVCGLLTLARSSARTTNLLCLQPRVDSLFLISSPSSEVINKSGLIHKSFL